MWPSAVVLARWIASHPDAIYNKNILELGAGCGLSGIAASTVAHSINKRNKLEGNGVGKSNIILTDFNEKVIENLRKNIILNDLADNKKADDKIITEVAKLDFYMHSDGCSTNIVNNCEEEKKEDLCNQNNENGWIDGTTGETRNVVDVIIGADIICRPEDAVAVSKTIRNSLKVGGEAILVCADSEHRFGMDILKDELLNVGGLEVFCEYVSEMEDNNGNGLELTSGYVDGMKLLFFRVTKLDTTIRI